MKFREAFNDYARRTDAYIKQETENAIGSLEILFDFDETDEKHKETLFKLKLKMFEQESVKKSKSKTGKADIRKAKTPVEAVKAFSKFIK